MKALGSPLAKGETRGKSQPLLILFLEFPVSPYELVEGTRLLLHVTNPNGKDPFAFRRDRVHLFGRPRAFCLPVG